MAPNNIETQIREKLNARELQPSPQAWDRLDAMLSVAEEKKTKRSPFLSLPYIGIAASILVFVTVGLFLFNPKNSDIKTNETIVINEGVKDTTKTISTPSEPKLKENTTPNPQSQPLVQIEKVPLHTNQNSINKKAKENQNQISIINQSINKSNQQTINQKPQEIVAFSPKKEETIMSPKATVVNPETIVASNENVSKKEVLTNSKVKVNANSLLSEVDGELELSFREKVFKKVTKNYKEVKVALANRNLEQ